MTALLLDTHTMLWFFWDDPQLSADAKAAIDDHALAVEGLPLHHRDPFDRLLIAQSMIENLPIVSADSAFAQYGVERLW